jgi:hypothetical protein
MGIVAGANETTAKLVVDSPPGLEVEG